MYVLYEGVFATASNRIGRKVIGKIFEGRTGDANIQEAIRKAVSAAAEESGAGGFKWDLVSIDGSHGFVPFEIGVKIKLTDS